MHVRSEEISSLSQRKSSKVSAGLCPGDVPGFKTPAARVVFLREDEVSRMRANQRQKTARRMGKTCWSDRLLFVAIAGCILSASGVIPKTLSSVAGDFLLVCFLILTAVMLFWLLCPMSITEILSVLRFRAGGAQEKHAQSG
jgi:hypothetical protein